MRRAAPTLPVTAKMLRHFAIVSVVITSGLAMFASGEGQEILTEKARQTQLRAQEVRNQRQRATQRTVVVDGLRVAPGTKLAPAEVGGGGGPSGSGGESIYDPTDSPALAYAGQGPQQGAAGPRGPGPDGVIRDANGAVIPPPAALMRNRGKPGQAQTPSNRPNAPTQAQIDAVIAASAQRAGGGSGRDSE